MKHAFFLALSGSFFFGWAQGQVLINKIDSTLKNGKIGYHVICRNKNVDQNQLNIKPVGFDSEAREAAFMIRGRVTKAQIDDLNNDGYPDLVLYIYSDSNATIGSVYAMISSGNKGMIPCALPDAMMDGKINTGYKGHDEYSLLEGYLMQKFPIYKPGDDKNKPTGGTRSVLYKLTPENGGFKFSLIRFSDAPQQ
jgi:hypothetical protein